MQTRATPQLPIALLALSLCALWALACAIPLPCVSPAQPSPTPIVNAVHSIPPPPPSIEMRVAHSDAIVRARPPAVSGEIRTVPSADKCVAPTYLPVIVFEFPVTEYIKSSGGDALSVEWQFGQAWMFEDGHTYPTKEEAQRALTSQLEHRNAAWETRDALLFLQAIQPPGSASATTDTYKFTRIWFNDYTLDATDKPWLPLADATQTDVAPAYLLDSKPAEGNHALPTIPLAQLRATADAIAILLKAGEGIEGYENCVRLQLAIKNESIYNSPVSRPLDTDEISRICRSR